jgi:hypothetical protein
MTPEDRLRQAIEARTSSVEPSADALSQIEEKLMEAQRSDNRKRVLIGLGAAAAVVGVVVAALVLADDDDAGLSSEGSSTTSESTTSSSTTSTTDSTTTTTTGFQGVDPDLPVFPDPTTSQRFDDPQSVARAFATDLVGFGDPVVGDFQQGDPRSGEVEVRSFAAGAPTVVLVRQLEDDHWYVVGATTDSIQLTTPAARDTISSPQALEGDAYAFEGNVQVRLFVDGVQEPIATTFVTGRGDGVLGPFSGELDYSDDSGATHGVLVLNGTSGEDGSATEAIAIRVLL